MSKVAFAPSAVAVAVAAAGVGLRVVSWRTMVISSANTDDINRIVATNKDPEARLMRYVAITFNGSGNVLNLNGHSVVNGLMSATGPTNSNTLNFNFTPQVVKPIIEAVTNYSFFRGHGIEIEAKDKLVKRLGRSPDKGDACIMCLAAMRDIMNSAWVLISIQP